MSKTGYLLVFVLLGVLKGVSASRYEVRIKTRNTYGSGYRYAKFYLRIYGPQYLKTGLIGRTRKFSAGEVANINVDDSNDLTDICGVTIETSIYDEWCIVEVRVTNLSRNKGRLFAFNKCLYNSKATRTVTSEDGEWSLWGKWTSCSGVCETNSTRSRARNCVVPSTQCTNSICITGDRYMTENCTTPACPQVVGTWGSWTTWSSCNETAINETRTRQCNCSGNPCYNNCFGSHVDIRSCPQASYSPSTVAPTSTVQTKDDAVKAEEDSMKISVGISLGIVFGLSVILNIVLVIFLGIVLRDYCCNKQKGSEHENALGNPEDSPFDAHVYNN